MSLETLETTSEVSLEIAEQNNRTSASALFEAYSHATEIISHTKTRAIEACQAAIKCGAMFNAKKEEVGHGNWKQWLDKYLPEVTIRNVQRWMQVANATSSSYLTNGGNGEEIKKPRSLNQVLKSLRKVTDDSASAQRKRLAKQSKPIKATNGEEGRYLTLFHNLFAEKDIEALVATEDFSSWEENELEVTVSVLEPLTRVRNRMEFALAAKLKPAMPDFS